MPDPEPISGRVCRVRSSDRRLLLSARGADRLAVLMLELVLADRTRVPLVDDMTIGRAPGSTRAARRPGRLAAQARISVSAGEVLLEDAGSSYGTWLDGRRLDGREPLRDGSRIRIGDQELVVERHRDEGEAGRTVVVPAETSLAAPATGSFGTHPKVRSGYALKRLEASEGERRWILRDLESDRFLRMSDADAKLFERLDGRHSLADLVREAEQDSAEAGPARLARLLSELADRGLLSGVEGAQAAGPSHGRLQRLAAPREKTWAGAGQLFDRMYRHGGWRLFSRPALAAIAVLAIAGLGVFPYLVVGRYGTPFVVAQKVGVGALIFLVGRLAVVTVHETAHGLTMASLRPAGAQGGPQGAADLPVRVRGHLRGVVRAQAPADRDQRGGAGVRPDVGRAVRARLPGPARRSHPGHPLPARLRGVRRGVLQPQPVRRARRLSDPGRRAGRAGPAAARSRAALPATERAASGRRLPVLARYAAAGVAWSVVAACFAAGSRFDTSHGSPRSPRRRSCGRCWRSSGSSFFLPVIAVWHGRCASAGAAGRVPRDAARKPRPPPACSSGC